MASESSRKNRDHSASQAVDVYDNGYLRVEYESYYVACGGHRVALSLKEFLIFSRLVRNVNRIVPSAEIWRSAWGMDAPYNSLSLRVHIYRLRRTFDPFGLRIESMVGVGYFLSIDKDGASDTN